MDTEIKSKHVTPVGGNVFADLGFGPKEAAMLKTESDRIIADKLAAQVSQENPSDGID